MIALLNHANNFVLSHYHRIHLYSLPLIRRLLGTSP